MPKTSGDPGSLERPMENSGGIIARGGRSGKNPKRGASHVEKKRNLLRGAWQ
jgi:hypothetical protein